jgi:hypothetical protein
LGEKRSLEETALTGGRLPLSARMNSLRHRPVSVPVKSHSLPWALLPIWPWDSGRIQKEWGS